MTGNRMPVDDPAILSQVLASADALLLDFDGPICSVFAGLPAPVVAEQLREVLADGGRSALPPETQKSDDPFDVLDFAATLSDEDAAYVEAALRAHEVEAIATAEPTIGAHALIRRWRASGRKLAIVSNNSFAAVEAYVHLHDLTPEVDFISARTSSDPSLLKPDPFLLKQAAHALDVGIGKCVLVGDSLTDLQAAKAVAMPAIGYANKPGKTELFADEDPNAVATTVTAILAAS